MESYGATALPQVKTGNTYMANLIFHINGDMNTPLEFCAELLINAGYTGRDTASVAGHIAEMKAAGIPAPKKTPCFFRKDPNLLSVASNIRILDKDCSGEAEFVLLRARGEWFIGCGSDVFDKRVEALDAAKSKHLYPNQISRDIWRLADIADHLDSLILRSWIGKSRARLYQEGNLANILKPEDMLRLLIQDCGCEPHDGFVMFGGTIPCLVEGMPFTDCFETELADPVRGRYLRCRYELVVIN